MNNEIQYRLCGGVFFVLLLAFKKDYVAQQSRYENRTDGLDDVSMLFDLVRLVNPSLQNPAATTRESIKTAVSNFKTCQFNGGSYLPFEDNCLVSQFDKRVHDDWGTVLDGMSNYLNNKIDIKGKNHKDVMFVSTLIDLIKKDDSIDESEQFLIEEDGSPAIKAEIIKRTQFNFYSFILGVWHYVVVNKRDNKIGKDTVDDLCPSNGGNKREYSGHLGEDLVDSIRLTYSNNNLNDMEDVECLEDFNHDESSQQQDFQDPQVTGNQGPSINFNGSIGQLNQNFGTININGNQ